MCKLSSLLLLFLFFLFPSALAEIPSRPDYGSVHDFANTLTSTEEMIISGYADSLSSLSSGTFVLVTVPSLDGMEIHDYGHKLFNSWDIGSYSKGDGILILFAPNEKRIQMLTGKGISHSFGTEQCKSLVDDVCANYFANNQYSDGLIKLSKSTCIKAALLFCPLFDDPSLIQKLMQ